MVISDTTKEDCETKDAIDLVKELFGNKKKEKKPRAEKNLSLLLLPNFSVNPANGVLYGVAAVAAWHMGDKATTRISVVDATVAYTTQNILISSVRSNIYTKNDKMFLEGDWRYYLYSLPTFGLGTNAPDTTFDRQTNRGGIQIGIIDGGFSMKYDFLVIHEIVNWRIRKNLYAGVGYHLDSYWNIVDENLQLDTIPLKLTPHWGYAKTNGFDSSKYMLSGLSANLMYDSRDNQINP